jgi:hypothetical protein
MNKLFRTISALLAAFALSSLLIYRARLGDDSAPPPKEERGGIQSDVQTIEGQIGIVNTGDNTLTLIEDGQEVTFIFDGRTAIVESGRAVQPASIPQGASAAVKFTQRGGKNWARKIELLTDRSSDFY